VDYSEQTAIQIDAEVRRILLEAYERAKLFLRRNLEVLHKMAETLLERESIDGAEIDEILHQFGTENGGLRGAAAATARAARPCCARARDRWSSTASRWSAS